MNEPTAYVLSFTSLSLGFGALVASTANSTFWLARIRVPGAASISALAFTLYLTHKAMIHMAKHLVPDYMEHQLLIVLLASALVVIGSCSPYFVVERPFLRLRDKLLNH
jgi:peptidoglycan/LPS O-acetylase OafA/YrhL